MTIIQSINITFISHSTAPLLPHAVPELPDIETSHSTTANLLPDAAPRLSVVALSHSNTIVRRHDANLPLTILANHLQKMSSHYIVEEHRIECPENVVEILKKEAGIEFIKEVSTVAAKYIELLKTIATLDEWCLVGTEWRNLKEKIDRITSNSSNPNKNRPLWKLPSVMHAYILSYLSNEDVLRVSFIARGSLSKMVHQDESFWQQRALYQLGGEQATTVYTGYLYVPKPWKKICLILTYKGIESPERHELGSFKEGRLNGPGKRFTFGKKERIFTDSLSHRPGKILHEADTVEEGIFMNGILTTGIITYLHKCKEEGTFKYGKLCGQGIKIYFSGLIHIEEGLFEDSKLNGKGKRIWTSKQVEQGLFKNDRFISGKRTDSHGNTEEGTFEFGRLYQGIRKKKLVNGIMLEEEGIFHIQGLHGKGKRILTQRIEGNKFAYDEFKTERKIDSQRDTEEGIFLSGKLIQGTKTFAVSVVRQEEGTFENKRLHGKKGKRILRTGKIKEGNFKHEKSIPSASTSSSFSSFFKGCFTSG